MLTKRTPRIGSWAKLVDIISSGYDPENALLDIFDNSVDADANTVQILFERSSDDLAVIIADNGFGMDFEKLDNALDLASAIEKGIRDLGRFGIGLKGAAAYLGDLLEIISRSIADPSKTFYGCIDFGALRNGQNEAITVREATPEQAALLKSSHGTIVRISKSRLEQRDPKTLSGHLAKRIGRVYRKKIARNLDVRINGKKIDAIDPLMLAEGATILLGAESPDGKKIPVGGGHIYLKLVELPPVPDADRRKYEPPITARNAGFYVMRNGREIDGSMDFGLFDKSEFNARFRCEVAFGREMDDYFSVEPHKMHIIAKEAVKDVLRREALPALKVIEDGERERRRDHENMVDFEEMESFLNEKISATAGRYIIPYQKRAAGDDAGSHSKGAANPRAPRTTADGDSKKGSGIRLKFAMAKLSMESNLFTYERQGSNFLITINTDHPYYVSWKKEIIHDRRMMKSFGVMIASMALSGFNREDVSMGSFVGKFDQKLRDIST